MKNPIQDLLDKSSLTVAELAKATGHDDTQISSYKTGRVKHLPKRFLERMTELGCDSDKLERDYRRWRSEETEKVLSKIEFKNA